MKMNKKMLTVMVMTLMLVLVFAGCRNIVEPDSRGLVFTLSEDGTYYSLTSLGGLKDAEIVVPAQYEGKPVKNIAGFVFADNDTVTKVVVSEGIEVIGNYAFDSCNNLKTIELPESLTLIGEGAFARCSSLEQVSISKNVTHIGVALDGANLPENLADTDYIGASAFRAAYNLRSIDVDPANAVYKSVDGNLFSKDGKTIICYAFGKKNAENYTYEYEIPEGVENVAPFAFIGCNFTKITVSSTVKIFDDSAFAYNLSLREIVFNGTVEQWNKVKKSSLVTNRVGSDEYVYQLDYGVPAPIVECNDTFCNVAGFLCGEGLEYTLSDDGTYYILTGMGEAETLVFGTKTLVVPSKYNFKPVKAIADGALENGSKFTTVELLEGIESIGERAFAYFSTMTNVIIPSTVTHIGSAAFGACSALATITLNDNAAYKTVDGNLYDAEMKTLLAYASGNKNEEFVIPDTVSVIDDMAFYGCDSIVRIDLPESLTYIGAEAFAECSNLLYVVFGKDVEAWRNMEKGENWGRGLEEMFIECTDSYCYPSGEAVGAGLEYKLDENGVYYVASVGSNTEEDLVIPSKYDGYLVKYVAANAFEGNTTIITVRIIEGVESINDNAFLNCTNIKEVNFANSVKSIGNYAFSGCTALVSSEAPESLVTLGDGAFKGCTNLQSFELSAGLTTIGNEAFKDCTALARIAIPASVTSIGNFAFENCTVAKSVSIGSKVATIGEAAFRNCSALSGKVVLPASLTVLGNDAFSGCSNIGVLEIANGLTVISENAFADCTSLTSLVIGKSVTSIAATAFNTCEAITSITFGGNMEAWASIQTAANWAAAVPENLIVVCADSYCFLDGTFIAEGIAMALSIDGKYYMVESVGSYNGSDLIIPDKYNKLPVKVISMSAFENYTNLESISFMGQITHIGSRAFAGCTNLSTINFCNTITDIEAEAFEGCTSLVSVVLPGSLENIGDRAFADCSALAEIEFRFVPTTATEEKPGASTAAEGWKNINKGEGWADGVATDVVKCVTVDSNGEATGATEEVSIIETEEDDE